MIYKQAAKYVKDGAGKLSNRVYADKNLDAKSQKHVYALVSKALSYKQCLEYIIDQSQIVKTEKKLGYNTAFLMIYDLLLGSKRLNCGKCYEKEAILRHKTRLHGELTKYKVRNPKIQTENKPMVRWIRFNKPNNLFKRLNLQEVDNWKDIEVNCYYKDEYVPDLYAIHPKISVGKLEEYKDGSIIIQDRASCFPVTVITSLYKQLANAESGGEFIDACAAPGNKTSQLAKFANKVTAYERDAKRSETLHKMINAARLKNVDIQVMDFIKSEPKTIDGLIVDPSCSGSGIFRNTTVSKDRLANLAEFQYVIMLHALKYDAKIVVYSTCSVHEEENEKVVARLLENEEVKSKWRLSDRRDVIPNWERRGLGDMQGCIRVENTIDGGIGFFAACFQRID